MPFVFDLSEQEFDEETEDFVPPRAEEFIYLPPPKFGGAREPVDISQHLKTRARGAIPAKPEGFMQTLKSILRSDPAGTPQSWSAADKPVSTVVLPALAEAGVRRIYCRYDGGQDEGFSWLEFAELGSGKRLSEAELLALLASTGLADELAQGQFIREPASLSPQKLLENVMRYWVCDEWASWLLGRGYGTGEFTMYGAFLVDLEKATIVDDDRAEPVVENIELNTGKD